MDIWPRTAANATLRNVWHARKEYDTYIVDNIENNALYKKETIKDEEHKVELVYRGDKCR